MKSNQPLYVRVSRVSKVRDRVEIEVNSIAAEAGTGRNPFSLQ